MQLVSGCMVCLSLFLLHRMVVEIPLVWRGEWSAELGGRAWGEDGENEERQGVWAGVRLVEQLPDIPMREALVWYAPNSSELPACHHQAEGGNLRDGEEWKQVPAQHYWRTPSLSTLPFQVPLHNRLKLGEELRMQCKVHLGSCLGQGGRFHTSAVKERRVIVGDSLLRGTEGPICMPDPTCREACCITGAWVRDITRRLIVQASRDRVTGRSLNAIKMDFMGCNGWCFPLCLQWLGGVLRRLGKQIWEKSEGRDWCHRGNCSFSTQCLALMYAG